jgi:hypothetical protein
MLDRALLADLVAFRETPSLGGTMAALHLGGRLRDAMRRLLRWLNRLIEAGGPMS